MYDMKKKLLYIDSCIRKEGSRTLYIASALMKQLEHKFEIEKIDLSTSPLLPIDTETYARRNLGVHHPLALEYAKKFATADVIIVAAPFWDMSLPAIFKVFCENISINGITFKNANDGSTRGNCAASKMILITTRGMEIEDECSLDQASSYMRALCWLWGIQDFSVISAIGMDMCDEQTRRNRLNSAIERGMNNIEDW